MRYAVISDVHSNHEALTAVLGAAREQGVESFLFLGDLVGYNADPDACADTLSGLPLAGSVRGNHDKAVSGLMDLSWFNHWARTAALWTRGHAAPRTMAQITALACGPASVGEGSLICHGAPMDEDAYIPSQEDPGDCIRFLEREFPAIHVCFFGHTHVAGGWSSTGRLLDCGSGIILEPDRRYLINPGSVGQPRDGNPRASFGILDTGRGTYRNLRIAYDVETVQRKVLAAGLPRELADRLARGR